MKKLFVCMLCVLNVSTMAACSKTTSVDDIEASASATATAEATVDPILYATPEPEATIDTTGASDSIATEEKLKDSLQEAENVEVGESIVDVVNDINKDNDFLILDKESIIALYDDKNYGDKIAENENDVVCLVSKEDEMNRIFVTNNWKAGQRQTLMILSLNDLSNIDPDTEINSKDIAETYEGEGIGLTLVGTTDFIDQYGNYFN